MTLHRLGRFRDLPGCGGPQSPKSTRLTFEVDGSMAFCRSCVVSWLLTSQLSCYPPVCWGRLGFYGPGRSVCASA